MPLEAVPYSESEGGAAFAYRHWPWLSATETRAVITSTIVHERSFVLEEGFLAARQHAIFNRSSVIVYFASGSPVRAQRGITQALKLSFVQQLF
jgi:hypothetical protein